MADENRDQRTEAPSPKRLADAVRKGDVLQSRDLAAAIVMIIGIGWMIAAGPWLVGQCLAMLREALTLRPDDIAHFDPARSGLQTLSAPALPMASLFALTLAGACIVPVLLGSAGFRAGAVAPKLNRLDPLAGLRRMFGAQGLIELLKTLAKAALLGGIGYVVVAGDSAALLGLGGNDVPSGAAKAGAIAVNGLIFLAVGLVAIAALDVPLQYFQRMARLRMTNQEVKDELRQSEGAPEQKLVLRRRQQEIAAGRKALEQATVVLTNPSHFAVALRYVPGEDAAPVVVARGRDESAQAIKAMARERAVPCLEYPQLTRAIYFTSRAGQVIAEDLYVAVATVLAFIFQLDAEQRARARQPQVDVPAGKRFDAQGRVET